MAVAGAGTISGGYKSAASALGPMSIILPAIAVISGVVNVLALAGSLYMLQVYDRVLTSHNVPTLVVLSLLVAAIYGFQAILEVLRSRVFIRLATRFDHRVSPLALKAIMRTGARHSAQDPMLQPIGDVDALRSFISGPAPLAIFDMPWMPVYIGVVYLLHPVLGLLTLIGATFLLILTILTEAMVRRPNLEATAASRHRNEIAQASWRNAEVLSAMGFGGRVQDRFRAANAAYLGTQERLNRVSNGLSVVSKVFRLMLQSALLGTGAYLTIQGEMSAGAIIASSIIASRALAPIEVAISHWKSFVAARQAAKRINRMLEEAPAETQLLQLPKPSGCLSVENVSVLIPDTQRLAVNGVRFELQAKQVMAIIGPSASGKTCLARALTGIWPAVRGSIRIDGAEIDRWSEEGRGRHIGLLPQDIELFDGTVAENISRFDPNPDSKAVIAAAKAADIHEIILRLPSGYETKVGTGGANLSAGQRQRLGLARALYGDPFLVVLDEPNSNLDAEGEVALVRALKAVAARGGIAIVIAHRPSVLAAADVVGVMTGGQLSAFGPRDEILNRVLKQQPAAAQPLEASSTA